MADWIIYIALSALIGIVIGWLLSRMTLSGQRKMYLELNSRLQQDVEKNNTELQELRTQREQLQTSLAVANNQVTSTGEHLNMLKTELDQERDLLSKSNEQREMIRADLAAAENEIKSLRQKLDEYQEDVVNMEKRFENLANRIFEEKTNVFKEQNKDHIKGVLEPLRERIQSFEKRIGDVHTKAAEQHGELKQELKQLQDLNQQMSEEANNLTRALKGDKKIQGNWGELILESILEKSGLEKGREYEVQQSLKSDDGQRFQADVIIHLPDQKKMIIDSKVSLVAYEKMINADTEEEQKQHLKAHTMAIRNHVKQLGDKSYHDLVDKAPNFVLMFIPIETAFSVATVEDPKLYGQAFEKSIVIVTPSTLLVSLKTVDSLWQHEKQRKYSQDIAQEAGKMYDKFELLLQDLRTLGDRLNTTKKSYDSAMNKLVDGSGNLIRRAEKLKKLGAKANKQIKDEWLKRADHDQQDLLES